jgi:hypothetical protein
MVDSLRYSLTKQISVKQRPIRVAGKIGRSLRYTVWHRRPGTTCGMRLMIIPILPATLHGGLVQRFLKIEATIQHF